MKEVGSRGYNVIEYKDTCVLSGVNLQLPAHIFVDDLYTVILRADFVDYCFGYLSYKFAVANEVKDLALLWSDDEWKFSNNKVYRDTLNQDFRTVTRTLAYFEKNFLKSDAKKIIY